MPEVIADLDRSVLDTETAQEYFVNVVGEPRADGTWEAWLEFVPPTDDVPLVTGTETTQPSRADILRWAEQLTGVFLEGAFERARLASDLSRAVTTAPLDPVDPLPSAVAPLDPFELLKAGKATLRTALERLTRAELLAVIDAYNLNPPGHSLARLSNRQLVVWVTTATEVQMTGRLD
jgi:hypothetical protein